MHEEPGPTEAACSYKFHGLRVAPYTGNDAYPEDHDNDQPDAAQGMLVQDGEVPNTRPDGEKHSKST